jgi:protein-arginine kinase activator protein McsA
MNEDITNIKNAIELIVDILKELHPELNRESKNYVCPECKIDFSEQWNHEPNCKIGKVQRVLRKIDR